MRCGFKLTIYEVTSMPSDLGPYKLHSSAKYFIRAGGRAPFSAPPGEQASPASGELGQAMEAISHKHNSHA